jgi:hypothetical protein
MYRHSVGQKRGGSGILKKEDIDYQILQNCRQVRCQRFFVQKEHSQYFEVQSGEEQKEGSVRQSKEEDVWSQAWEQVLQHYDRIQSDDTIQLGETDEVNP